MAPSRQLPVQDLPARAAAPGPVPDPRGPASPPALGALAARGDTTLTGSKYLWLYAEENLPEQHRARFAQLKALTLKTGRAWALKESLRELWAYTRVGWAQRH